MLKCNVARLETSHWIELKWKLGGEHSKLSSPLHNAKTKPRMIWYHNWWGSRAVWGRRWNLNSIRFKFRYGDLITRLQHTRIFMVNFMAINHQPEPNMCCSTDWYCTHCSQARTDKVRWRLQIYLTKKPHSKYHFNKHYCTIVLSAVQQYYSHLKFYFAWF